MSDSEVLILAECDLINLKDLNLADNQIGAEGAIALCRANLLNLTQLNLIIIR